MKPLDPFDERLAGSAFSKQSPLFDDIYALNTIVQYKRERVRDHASCFLSPGSSILELNSGTGQDAVYFAQQGYTVHATDLSGGMMEQLEKKVRANGLQSQITSQLCSFNDLSQLRRKGPYDMIFSNFAGLNCTSRLTEVVQSLDPLLKPGGIVTLVLLPPFCLWESLLMVKGKFKTATRRWFSGRGRMAKVEGLPFRCWYYTPSTVINGLGDRFETVGLEGLCTIVPPSYIEGFAEKYPFVYSFLQKTENRLAHRWPWKYIGDYYIISLRKKV